MKLTVLLFGLVCLTTAASFATEEGPVYSPSPEIQAAFSPVEMGQLSNSNMLEIDFYKKAAANFRAQAPQRSAFLQKSAAVIGSALARTLPVLEGLKKQASSQASAQSYEGMEAGIKGRLNAYASALEKIASSYNEDGAFLKTLAEAQEFVQNYLKKAATITDETVRTAYLNTANSEYNRAFARRFYDAREAAFNAALLITNLEYNVKIDSRVSIDKQSINLQCGYYVGTEEKPTRGVIELNTKVLKFIAEGRGENKAPLTLDCAQGWIWNSTNHANYHARSHKLVSHFKDRKGSSDWIGTYNHYTDYPSLESVVSTIIEEANK
jgi:hypothetical protein